MRPVRVVVISVGAKRVLEVAAADDKIRSMHSSQSVPGNGLESALSALGGQPASPSAASGPASAFGPGGGGFDRGP